MWDWGKSGEKSYRTYLYLVLVIFFQSAPTAPIGFRAWGVTTKRRRQNMGRISAFVLINVRTGMIDQVISELIKVVNKNPHVETLYADSTTGKFDIIHMIRSEEMSGFHAFIVGELQNIEGITSTVTEVVTYEPDIKAAREESPESLKCYMLMTVEVGKIEEVLSALASSSTEDSCITKVACTTGEYDVITRIESTDIPSLYSFISQKLHVIGGITSTMTHIVAREISYR